MRSIWTGGTFEQGLHLRFGIMMGENWKNLSASGQPSRFVATQGILTYKALTRGRRVTAIEPLGRASWGDPDTDASDDSGLLFTLGLVLHFEGRNKVATNVDVWSPSQGDTAWSFRVQTYLYF